MSRTVCWFSCGAASAVATKIAIETNPEAIVAYCDTGSEHPDNARFLKDCEAWFGREILILRNAKYQDTWDVFEKERYLVGIAGARCTAELKKVPRFAFQKPDDRQVFGFTSEEAKRAVRFNENNFDTVTWFPLIEQRIGKRECFDRIQCAGIELPMMYRLGYKNNNCIGCVKGGAGYWNKIRRDFPDVFDRMAALEVSLGAMINKVGMGDGTRKRVFLRDLPPDVGRYESELPIGCGLLCDVPDSEENEK